MSIFGLKRTRGNTETVEKAGTSCLLIDYENLAISLRENCPDCTLDLGAVLDEAKKHSPDGRIDAMYAYADWRHFAQHANALVRLGIKTVQAPSFRYQGKNATDIQMAVEATDLLHLHPELQVFVLATGDSDFTPLVQLLRSRGKRVIGIGVSGSVSKHLTTVCDEFIHYEELTNVEAANPAKKASTPMYRERVLATDPDLKKVSESTQPYRTNQQSTRLNASPVKAAPSREKPRVNGIGNGKPNGNSAGSYTKPAADLSGLEASREAIGLDPNHLLTSSRLKQLLPMAAEAWHEAKPEYAPQMKHVLMRRFPDQMNQFEAQVMASLLEKTNGLGQQGWLVVGGSDGDLLFDLLLHASQRALSKQGSNNADDPERLGQVLLHDSIERPELRMRIVRGKSAVQRFYQLN
ncbi:NYN domain-containing protein [bacterium]|nr:NYN domain-containing protein [bacterium]